MGVFRANAFYKLNTMRLFNNFNSTFFLSLFVNFTICFTRIRFFFCSWACSPKSFIISIFSKTIQSAFKIINSEYCFIWQIVIQIA